MIEQLQVLGYFKKASSGMIETLLDFMKSRVEFSKRRACIELEKILPLGSPQKRRARKENTEDYVKGTKRFAFETSCEEARVLVRSSRCLKKWATSDLFKWGLK